MALYRKQRNEDAAPQYVRITKSRSSSRALRFLQEKHVHAQRVYAKRFAASARSRKISSLQLRACFMLCVLLYFGAIYFADDIVSIGRVVSSEQASHNFFMPSLRPRVRGNVRVERATYTERVNTDKAKNEDELQQHIEQDKFQLKLLKKKKKIEAKATVAESGKAQAMKQTNSEATVLPQNGRDVEDHTMRSARLVVSIPTVLEDDKPSSAGNKTRKAELSGIKTKPSRRVDLKDEYYARRIKKDGLNDTSTSEKKQPRRYPPPPTAAHYRDKVNNEDEDAAFSSNATVTKSLRSNRVSSKPMHSNLLAPSRSNPGLAMKQTEN